MASIAPRAVSSRLSRSCRRLFTFAVPPAFLTNGHFGAVVVVLETVVVVPTGRVVVVVVTTDVVVVTGAVVVLVLDVVLVVEIVVVVVVELVVLVLVVVGSGPVVTLKVSETPPMVRVASVVVELIPDEVCCTVTVLPLTTVPLTLV